MEFKDKLKALRKEKGLSQQELANAIFVSRSAVAKWENGLGLPGEESLEALQDFFAVPADHFATQKPEAVIVQKNRRIKRLNLQLTALLLAIFLAAAWIVPNTKWGIKLTVSLFRSGFEEHALAQLADPAVGLEHFWGFRVDTWTEDAVFYEGRAWGYSGVFYSVSGEPVGYQGTEMDFYRCGGQWYWGEEEGDNWMHVEHIAGNWYWYEMHF